MAQHTQFMNLINADPGYDLTAVHMTQLNCSRGRILTGKDLAHLFGNMIHKDVNQVAHLSLPCSPAQSSRVAGACFRASAALATHQGLRQSRICAHLRAKPFTKKVQIIFSTADLRELVKACQTM